jgi:PIN domain nuclease of toxin-antitoxin system
MSDVVLDASALIALLKEEPGAAMVAQSLGSARMSAVNLAEVISHFVHLGMPAREVEAMLNPLPMTIVVADLELARIAGRLRAMTADAGLSLGDRFCLAVASRDQLPAWTADKQWRSISDVVGIDIVVIR